MTNGGAVRRPKGNRPQRRTQRGLQYNLNSTRMGRDYRPEAGFLSRRDFTTANAFGNWFIYTDKHRWLRRYYPGATTTHVTMATAQAV